MGLFQRKNQYSSLPTSFLGVGVSVLVPFLISLLSALPLAFRIIIVCLVALITFGLWMIYPPLHKSIASTQLAENLSQLIMRILASSHHPSNPIIPPTPVRKNFPHRISPPAINQETPNPQKNTIQHISPDDVLDLMREAYSLLEEIIYRSNQDK